MRNSQKQNSLLLEGHNDIIREQLLSLLSDNESSVDNSLIRSHVDDILLGDSKKAVHYIRNMQAGIFDLLPLQLQQNPDVVLAGIQKDYSIYFSLSPENKKNIKVAKKTLDGIMNTGNISDVIRFFDNSYENKESLKKYFLQISTKNTGFYSTELEKVLIHIYFDSPEIYKLLFEKCILSLHDGKIGVGKKIQDFVVKNKEKYTGKDPEDIYQGIISEVEIFLGISKSLLGKQAYGFFTSLIRTISLGSFKSDNNEDTKEDDEINETEIDEEEGEESPPFSMYIGSHVSVWDNTGSSIVLEKEVFNSMTDISLNNYLYFYSYMKDLGLEFILQKHERLLQVASGINFYSDEGMTKGKILRLLNSIGKNIGIPETENENKDAIVSCFKSLDAAKIGYINIQSNGKIHNEFIINPSNLSGQSIVEYYMKTKGLIGGAYNELLLAKWK